MRTCLSVTSIHAHSTYLCIYKCASVLIGVIVTETDVHACLHRHSYTDTLVSYSQSSLVCSCTYARLLMPCVVLIRGACVCTVYVLYEPVPVLMRSRGDKADKNRAAHAGSAADGKDTINTTFVTQITYHTSNGRQHDVLRQRVSLAVVVADK